MPVGKRRRSEDGSPTASQRRVKVNETSTSNASTPSVTAPHAPSSALPTSDPRSLLSTPPCQSALLVVGTYHAVMAGLVYRKGKLLMKFSVKRHVGRVNRAAVTERYIASSGIDERVFLFTNKAEERLSAATRKKLRDAGEPLAVRLADLGSITPPAEVTALVFANGSQHLLCGCADGQLLIYRCRDWSLRTALTVHEKAVVTVAVHPGSHGSLAVTAGEDRVIAVLDLVKGRLLTKWKYNPAFVANREAATVAQTEERTTGPPKTSTMAPMREAPIAVLFSPTGNRLAALSRFSFVIYDTATMQPLCSFRYANPQPPDELHCCCFLTESTLLLGTEAGDVRKYHMEERPESPAAAIGQLSKLTLSYPEAVQVQAASLLAAPVKADVESRLKTPLRHINRIKAMQVQGSTLFSIDSSGIVIVWSVTSQSVGVELLYVTSANCQGRVTDMETLPFV